LWKGRKNSKGDLKRTKFRLKRGESSKFRPYQKAKSLHTKKGEGGGK